MLHAITKSFYITVIFLVVVCVCASFSFAAEKSEEKQREEENELRRALANVGSNFSWQVEASAFFFENMGEEGAAHLIALLKNNRDDRRIKQNSIYLLGRMGKDAEIAVPAIIPCIRDEDDDTKIAAARALGRIGMDSPEVIYMLSTLENNKNEWVRENAYRALKNIGTKKALRAAKIFKANTKNKK